MNDALLKITANVIEERKSSKSKVYEDMLATLVELKNKKTAQNFGDVEIAAHAAGFIIDGLETSAISLSFALYEVAANSNVQEKLYQEIKSALETYGDDLSYENIQDMSYLDNVCSGCSNIPNENNYPIKYFTSRKFEAASTFLIP